MFIEYQPGEKHGGKGAAISENLDSFRDAGLLLTNEDVVVDIDHLPKESIKALLKAFDIVTQVVWTDRGAHLWFKKPSWLTRRKDGVCRLGFEIEQHNRSTNPAGMTVKRNGVVREMENPGVRAYMPAIFKVDGKGYKDLTGMADGDGRNKSLFSHRMALQRNNVPDTDKICFFINKHVFADPLSESEMDGIMRDVSSTDDCANAQSAIATMLMNELCTVWYSGMLWWYNGTQYVADPADTALIRRVYAAAEGETTRFVDEVIKQMKYRSPAIAPETAFPIKFKNGVLKDGKVVPVRNYMEFTPYYIDIDYKADAAPVPIVDEYIDNLTGKDPTYRDLLMEVMGYVMITDPEQIRSLGKFFFFRGDGANGKGTLLQIMKKIYSPQNCTSLSIKQLTDERYAVTLIGKLANLGDDVEPEAIDNAQLKVLKNISTADTVSTRRLYAQSENATFTTKLYFTTNADIASFEKGYAYKRRVVWLPMFNKVSRPDPKFITKITTKESLEYWMSLVVAGYQRLYEKDDWTHCDAVAKYNDAYHEANNIMLRFAKTLDPDTEIVGKTVADLKAAFVDWDTEDNRFRPKLFKAAVWELYRIGLGVAKVGGKTRRVFMRQDTTLQTLEH